MRLRMGGASAARAQLWQERGASRHAHALNRPLHQLHAPGAAFQVPCATPSAAENYMSRKTAISPHHPAISTRRRGRGARRFHTRSKCPETPRGECDGRLLCSGPARHAHALVSQGDARTSARTPARTPARHAYALVSQGHARTTARARVRTSRARAAAAAASTRQVVLGHQPVRQQHNTRGSRTSAPRAPMGSPPAADTLVRWFSAINSSANKTTQKARGRPRRGRPWAARPRKTRAPVCFSRRAQCGARERHCRAAPALAVPT